MTINLGFSVGAMMGAYLTDELGFRVTSDIIGLYCFLVGSTYYLTANGY